VGRFLKIVNSCNIRLKNALTLHNFGDLKLPLRNIHGDTKADNIIFGEKLTVIDLDTAMSGYICADYGDMIRSVTAKEFSLSAVRDATNGFADGLDGLLTAEEINSLYGGIVLIISELAERYSGGSVNFSNKTAEQCLERERELRLQLSEFNDFERDIRAVISECFSV
jgi:Ser/Thr protein kinase RdoA (MazF antagonist)